MLSSFFRKSKPINFIIISFYMLVFFIIISYKNDKLQQIDSVGIVLGSIVCYVLTMLLLNYIIQKNELTSKSSHTAILFVFLSLLLPESFLNGQILMAALLVVLSLMSVVSIINLKDIKAKIFNAAICISIASLLYFWSILFMFCILYSIVIFDRRNYRNWLIPIVAWCTMLVLVNCCTLAFNDSFFSLSNYAADLSFSYGSYTNQKWFFLGAFVICLVFFLFFYAIKYKRKSAKIKPSMGIIMMYLITGLVVAAIAPLKTSAELYFVTGPLAIIGTTYIEQRFGKLIDEINIWFLVLFPMVILFLF